MTHVGQQLGVNPGTLGTWANEANVEDGQRPGAGEPRATCADFLGVNALAETVNGLFKTELVRRRGLWRGLDDLELAIWEWVDWWNHRRLHQALGYVPPVEHETTTTVSCTRRTMITASAITGALQSAPLHRTLRRRESC